LASQSFRVKNSLQVGTGVTITSGGNITAGVVTATSFVGSGSQLTGIVGNANYALVSGVSSSVVGGAISATSLSVTGVSTFDGAVKIRNGYNLNIGDNSDLRIYNDGTNSRIQETGSGAFYISGSDINIQQDSTNKNFARFVGGGAAELYYNDSKKFETSGIGITVTGTINSNQINVSGVVTASSFSGNASSATYATSSGIATYAINAGISTYATNAGISTYATSSGISTIAYGLTGTPDITVGIVTATKTIVNETRVLTGAEKVTRINGNTAILTYNSLGSNIGFCTNPSGDVTLNVINIPTTSDFDDYALTFAVIVTSTGTARTCTAVTLNGVSKSIKWVGGSLSSALAGVTTTNGQTIFTFTGINTVGSASTTNNYLVLGSASGGFW
jgi:hypothetical protein